MASSVVASIEDGGLAEEEMRVLAELGILVVSHAEERREMLGYIDELNAIDTELSFMLVMNLDCNLACPYCFEGSRRGKYYMSRETAGHFVAFTDNNMTPGRDGLDICFYGGEPLLSVCLIEDMAVCLKTIAEKKGVRFSFSLTTNGVLLTPAVIKRLKPLGLSGAVITLDGPDYTHNETRPFADGTGSFELITDNISDVCKEIDITINGNFSRANYLQFPQLFAQLTGKGISPDNVKCVKFNPVVQERKGIVSADFSGGCRSINETWLFEAGRHLRQETINKGFPVCEVAPAICMVEKKNIYTVNYDGGIYKCPGLIGQPEFKVGDVVNGVDDYSASHGLDNWKNEKCLDCVYLPLCFGGCRYMSLLGGGDITGLDCRKPYYDACLEGLVRQDIELGRRKSGSQAV
jgi:uncharacterized protein